MMTIPFLCLENYILTIKYDFPDSVMATTCVYGVINNDSASISGYSRLINYLFTLVRVVKTKKVASLV